MAVRRATHQIDTIEQFLSEYAETLSKGNVFLPPDAVEGELAPEIRLDFRLPLLGRVGPVAAQVLHRAPNGGVALRMPEHETQAAPHFRRLFDGINEVKHYLMGSGDLVSADQIADLQAAMATSEARIAAAEKTAIDAAQAAAAVLAAGPHQTGGGGTGPARRSGRGLPVPDLAGEPPALSGVLSDRSFRDAMVQLAISRASGLVTITDGDKTRYGFWSKGGPVAWRTDPLQEDEVLGMLLLRAGQLTKEQIAQSLEVMERTGSRQGEAFIEMGILTFPQLIMVLGKQCEFLLQRVMKARSGSWTFHTMEELPEQFLPPPLKVPSLLYRALFKHAREMKSQDLSDALKPHLDRYVIFAEDAVDLLADLRLDKGEAKMLEVIKSSTWRLRELYSVSPLSRGNTSATVWSLIELGFLDFQSAESDERYLNRVGRRVNQKLRSLAKSTHFDVLELHWICLDDEVEVGYQRLSAEFELSNYHSLTPELERNIQLIRERMAEAYEVLRVAKRRREYRKTVIEPFMILQSAELLAKQGEMGILRRDGTHAGMCYAKACELAPQRPDFREGLSRSKSLG